MKRILLPMVMLLAAACSQPAAENLDPSTEQSATETVTVTEGTAISADGLSLTYDVRGSGETTLVFVHCWSCDRGYWREQLDVFASDYQVVAINLGGHGDSGDDREDWSIASLAADVETVIQHLDIDRAILIGHSLGGPVSVEAARLMPQTVQGIACVDTLHNAENEFDPDFADSLASQLEADFLGERKALMRQMFPEGGNLTVADWVGERGETANETAAISLLRDLPNFDLRMAMSDLEVPIRCINASPLPTWIPETAIDVNQQYVDFDAVVLDGVGHFPHLEDPERFNTHLAEVIAEMAS